MWIDRFVEFVSGERATTVKNVTLAEDVLHDHFPGYPVLPPSLMIEGMAQTAGILVGEARQFSENVILGKIRRAEFTGYAGPGDQIQYHARIESLDEQAAVTAGVVTKNGHEIGQVDLIFSHVTQAIANLELPAHNFVFDRNFQSLLDSVRAAMSDKEATS
jgi:3-hydroxyacyl-[acyl-carrier-protein] dehydratase